MDSENDKPQRGIYPSMTALRMLDAVASLGNMHKAAEALFVTPSAVSHQLRKLEETLGAELMRRKGRKVELTSAGNRYTTEIRKALNVVSNASLPIADEEPFGVLRMNCASGLGTYWLSQHIGEFLELYPKIDVQVISSTDRIDIYSDEIDFSVLFGDGSWQGLNVQHLYTPQYFPVCSPRLIEGFGQRGGSPDVSAHTLIHHRNYSDWTMWLSTATKKSVRIERGIVFSDVTHAINAALAGHGVAMADDVLAGQAIRNGTLVRPFDTEISAPQAYYIVSRDDKLQRRIARAGIEWLASRFQGFILPFQTRVKR